MIEFIGNFTIVPSLPKKLEMLRDIVFNLYWSWNHEAIRLFRRLDQDLWEETNHNPVKLLGMISQKRMDEVANDDGFISHLNRVYSNLEDYLKEPTWYKKNTKFDEKFKIAYFSMEYGLTDCLQIYSGGLGVLSGDHLKSASDLGLPLYAIGLCYHEGYFQQYLTNDGWQQEKYDLIDFYNQPMNLVKDANNDPLKLSLKFPGRDVFYQIWKIQVGRVPLFLLDTNIPENSIDDREITKGLYRGNTETRIQQEIILGIGGLRALYEMKLHPTVCHMNEGHSAFQSLEGIRHLMKGHGLSFQEARDVGFYSNIFTTHTPVPAGIDIFSKELVNNYFSNYYKEELNLTEREFFKLGTILRDTEPTEFNMAHFAMNMAGYVNGVSKLHSKVSRKMWSGGFKDIPFNEIPIGYITNGIHTRTHISRDMYELLYRYLGSKFFLNSGKEEIDKRIAEIPDEELWKTHERRRERLVAFARKRLQRQIIDRGGSASELTFAKEVLDSNILTIGFARRFATYKRATLLFSDIERLVAILCDPKYPVQLIIAGKAHPHDDEGKELIQSIVKFAKDKHLRKRIIFLENYDMNVARYIVEGCDVWLNTPRRPLEASGTSGMKVVPNGGLNFSVLDGWWDEAYEHEVGWKIGYREEYDDIDMQDAIESKIIYETLENEIVKLFYDRGEDKLPRKWIAKIKQSLCKHANVYNTNRMVMEYADKYYFKSYEKRSYLSSNDWKNTKEFSEWKLKIYDNWKDIKILKVSKLNKNGVLTVKSKLQIEANIVLGNLSPDDVKVQVYYSKMQEPENGNNAFENMQFISKDEEKGIYKYQCEIICENTGQFGYTLRVLPDNPLLESSFDLGIIKWANIKE
ncbi:MAG: alpha-glucan family phosphorylase [Ignavibacteriales bacterium]|nr:alpha-glucan family phosphorylase [Ignavibacteriales bacterium]